MVNKSVAGLNLTNTSNLVLLDKSNATIWRSFYHPNDSPVFWPPHGYLNANPSTSWTNQHSSTSSYLLVASFVMKSATFISLPFLLFIYIDSNIHEDVAPQVVWSANQKNPISINATLRLSSERGLVLQDANRTTVWNTNIGTKSVASLNLSNMGNLMLLNQNNKTIRQSFDHPTDSLLPGKKLMVGQRLTFSVPVKYQIVFALPLWGGVVRFHRV